MNSVMIPWLSFVHNFSVLIPFLMLMRGLLYKRLIRLFQNNRLCQKSGSLSKIRSRPGKPNQRKGQNEKFMNFAHFCEFWCFFLRKTSTIHIELLFRNAPAKNSWADLSLVWFAGATPEKNGGHLEWGPSQDFWMIKHDQLARDNRLPVHCRRLRSMRHRHAHVVGPWQCLLCLPPFETCPIMQPMKNENAHKISSKISPNFSPTISLWGMSA